MKIVRAKQFWSFLDKSRPGDCCYQKRRGTGTSPNITYLDDVFVRFFDVYPTPDLA
ncbi:MAG: hypothetical protein OXU36_13300 [Candidatus Poribacteria bacterium]|nr:hypothetical protein [Candidatus Poribacteria bacterium]